MDHFCCLLFTDAFRRTYITEEELNEICRTRKMRNKHLNSSVKYLDTTGLFRILVFSEYEYTNPHRGRIFSRTGFSLSIHRRIRCGRIILIFKISGNDQLMNIRPSDSVVNFVQEHSCDDLREWAQDAIV